MLNQVLSFVLGLAAGVITRKEARQGDVLTKWFKNVDRNGNGKISINEIEDKPASAIFITR